MRLLHTSDWHLGRLFYNVHLTEDQAHVLEQLVALAKEAKVDAVLVAGDAYDRAVPPADAVTLLDEVLSRLVLDVGVPTILIAGNHDSPERIDFGSRLLAERGLHLVGSLGAQVRCVELCDAHGAVDVLAIPYAAPEEVRASLDVSEVHSHHAAMERLTELARARRTPGHRSVLLAHAFVVGGLACESERTLTVGGSGEVGSSAFNGFDYAALGHLHRPQAIGDGTLRYSGSLLKYSFSEASHCKSVTVVELDARGSVSTELVELSPRRDVRVLEGHLEELIAAGRSDAAAEDYLLARVMNPEPVLNAMGRLREVYPNVLHVERPVLEATERLAGPERDHRELSTIELFRGFYAHATSQSLGDEHRESVVAAIESVRRSEEEAS